MYHELVSKKALCSGVELLHGTNRGPPSLNRPPVGSTVVAFLEETSKDLKSYLGTLTGKKQQTVAVVVTPPRKKKRHRVSSNVVPKGVNPMADVVAMVHGFVTPCGRNEHKHMFRACFCYLLVFIEVVLAMFSSSYFFFFVWQKVMVSDEYIRGIIIKVSLN